MRKIATLPAAGLRLLLIDDNSRGLSARKLVLEEQGYSVTACSCPKEALARFETTQFDIVVTDYRMPNMNGVQLLAKLREIRVVPVVLMSGMVEVLGLNEANTGADAVVAKNANEIANMVRTVNRLATRPGKKPPAADRRRAKREKASGE